MKILQITAFAGWGCTGRIAVGISKVLTAGGLENAIAWGRIDTTDDSVETIRIGNSLDQNLHGLYTRLTDRNGYGSRLVTKKFIKELEAYAPDLIQLHILHGYYINLELLFDWIRERQIPVVWTFHDCWAFTGHCPYYDLAGCRRFEEGCHHCPQKKKHPASWLLDHSAGNWKKKKELFTGLPMTIVTPSAWLAGEVKRSFLKDLPVEVIHNGIDLNNFRPVEGPVRERYGLGEKRIVLGVSSTWADSKGIPDFIRLAELLPENYQVVLVGLEEAQKAALPEQIVGILRTDSVQELAELYSAADVFVNPTYQDNYPTTNLEALACGTPVVGYRMGGNAECLENNPYGMHVPVGDVEALAEAVKTWSEKKPTGGFAVDTSLLDQNTCFAKYRELYTRLLEKGN